jgi:cold shock CspA family protein
MGVSTIYVREFRRIDMNQQMQAQTGDRLIGTVNWLDSFSGIGFISSPRVNGDIFIPRCQGLKEGQQVEFTLVATDTGFGSEKVRPLLG